MSDAFESAFGRTNGLEGGWGNNPKDKGGETKYGITEKLARIAGWTRPMRELDLATARAIAKKFFWDRLNCDAVALLSYAVAEEMYDTYFNTGQCWLQRCLNRFNRMQTMYADIKEDMNIGPATLHALEDYLEKRGKDAETVMLRALNSCQGAYYLTISDEEHRELNEEFVYGWFLNRVEIK